VEELVTSPSFSLIHEYQGRFPLFHVDLYRMRGLAEVEELDLDPYLRGRGVTVLEWAERAEDLLPEATMHITISIREDLSRDIEVEDAP
jgi:tRNA threonylcarbamoyladenosine biosynthesis protein TsaE